MTKGRKIFAYILNFCFAGSGFLVVEGSKGFLKFICWLLPFIILNTYRSDIGLIWPLLVMLGSFIHLFKTIKKTGDIIDRDCNGRSNLIYGLGCLAQILYIGMGLVQVAAIAGGIKDWWGWPKSLAIFIAMPIAYIPILGTIVGIMGAIKSFGWTPMVAILLFCWPYALYAFIVSGGGLTALFSRKKVFRSTAKPDREDIELKQLNELNDIMDKVLLNIEKEKVVAQQLYEKGIDCDNDVTNSNNKTESFNNYLESAKLGHEMAQTIAGKRLLCGEGVKSNHREAAKWFRLAAKQGNSEAQYNLAQIYRSGIGLKQNTKEALKWFKKAALQGHIEAKESYERLNTIENH